MIIAMERLLELRIESVELRVVEFVRCRVNKDKDNEELLMSNLRFYFQECVHMNELLKHGDFIDAEKNTAHVFQLLQETVWKKKPFHERHADTVFANEDYQ